MPRRSHPGRSVAWLLSLALLVGGRPRPAPAQEADRDGQARLRQRLERLVASTHRLSWLEEAWERQGEQTEASRERCLWVAPDRWRLEVLEGRGRGAVITIQGDAVTVQLPSLLRFLQRHYRASDPTVRSLRGLDPREVGFLPDVREALRRWDQVRVVEADRRAMLEFPRGAGLTERLWLRADGVPERAEVFERGELVEQNRFLEVVLDPP